MRKRTKKVDPFLVLINQGFLALTAYDQTSKANAAAHQALQADPDHKRLFELNTLGGHMGHLGFSKEAIDSAESAITKMAYFRSGYDKTSLAWNARATICAISSRKSLICGRQHPKACSARSISSPTASRRTIGMISLLEADALP